MKKCKSLLGLVVPLIAVLLSGCGKESTTEEHEKLWVTAYATTIYDPVRRELYAEFENTQPDVKIDYLPNQYGEYYNKLTLQLASGKAPDVVFTENIFLPRHARAGDFISLDPFIQADKDFRLSDFHDVGLKMYQFEGEQYAMPGNLAVFVMFYNKDIFDAEDIAPPDETWDWDKLLEVSKKLTKRDSEGNVTRFAISPSRHYSIFMMQNGAKVYNDDYAKCIIDNEAAKEAIQFYAELADKHNVTPNLSQLKSYQTVDLFQNGKCAMLITGRWSILGYRNIKDFEWDVAPLPHGKKRATLLASHGWAVSKTCKNPKLAWEFVKYITGPAGARRVVDMGDCNPALNTLDDYFINEATAKWPKEKNDNQVYVDSLAYAYTDPFLHPWVPIAEIEDKFVEKMEEYREGEKTLDVALREFQDMMNKLIDERRPKAPLSTSKD